ncbi:MAG: hypothetical protein WBL38_00700 [Desulfomonilia bacterium]|nr:hypothetical protein [Deltaproteobacteria bacterium]MDI9542231.1 hypothetical protein [Pseudomonadota bacterium]HRR21536.1 hypothetical protein [Desulfomonilia bacterium]
MGRDSVDKTQEEIVEEMAKALGHSGDLLESVLEKMNALGKVLEKTADVHVYNTLVDEFNDLRREAMRRKEMLMIHREAIGVRRHRYLDAYYPIPPRKKKKPVSGDV